MASASEYAFYLGIGAVVATAALLHRRAWPLALLPVLTLGMFLSSVRTVIVLGAIALVVMLGLRSKRPRIALPVIAVAALALYFVAAPVLVNVSSRSGSDLVSHQLEGIAQPFDEDSSTLQAHLELIRSGVGEGLSRPLGRGTEAGTLASSRLGSGEGATEFDFSNAFVAFGLPGGLLFLTISGVALVNVGRRYTRSRDPLVLAALGVAVVTLGFWLVGAHYAVTPLLWVMLGWATRPADHPERHPRGPSAPRG